MLGVLVGINKISVMIKNNPKNQIGFTLIELMVTIAIVGILLAVALPSYSDFSRRQILKTSAQTLVKTLTNARVEAVTSGQGSSFVCWNLGDETIALPGGTGGETINAGQIVVFRNTLTGVTETISATQLISFQQGVVITDTDADNCISFGPQGRLTLASSPGPNPFGFLICRQGNDNTNSLRVEVSRSGRAASKLNSEDTTGLGVQDCV